MTTKSPRHRWTFQARFRRHAFGWKSRPAAERVRQAIGEIQRVARKDPLLAASGAVLFLERVSPAIEQVDSSSGALGGAVNRAIEQLVPIIAAAPADRAMREAWLERLYEAHAADHVPYIESLAGHWGELCVFADLASAWADRLLPTTSAVLGPGPDAGAFFHGTFACLSALHHAGRHDELLTLLESVSFWPYKRWAAKSLAATGRPDEAIDLAEASRGPWTSSADVDALCENVLLACGRVDDAYDRYAHRASVRTTYLATFRAIAARYPQKAPAELLADLVSGSPGEEGKWFAAAKGAGLFDEALELAAREGTDPQTLARAARDFAAKRPEFAASVGVLALRGFAHDRIDDFPPHVIRSAFADTVRAAEAAGRLDDVRGQIDAIAGHGRASVRIILRTELDRTELERG